MRVVSDYYFEALLADKEAKRAEFYGQTGTAESALAQRDWYLEKDREFVNESKVQE